MEVANLLPVVDRLEDNIDDLEEVLEPLLSRSLDETSKKLPLLERAKLHALLTYTLESLIFSYLSLHGVDAKEHPVFKELTRVRQYFGKIKALESPPEEEAKPTMKLDQQAARRFIAHGLAGNDQYDIDRAEKQAKEKARAQLKAAMLAKKAKQESAASTPQETQDTNKGSTKAESPESEGEEEEEAESSSESDESEDESPTEKVETKPTGRIAPPEDFIMLPSEPVADSKNAKKKTAKAKAKQRKEDIINAKKAERQAKRQAEGVSETNSKEQRKKARKERRRKKQAQRNEKKEKKKNKQKQKH